jgi:hypothetical protein
MSVRVAVAVVAALSACDRPPPVAAPRADEPPIPQAALARAATAGDQTLAWAPAGAELAVELDLARVRDNPVVGALYAAAVAGVDGAARLGLDYDLARHAELVVIYGYHVGTAAARALIFLRGDAIPDPGAAGVRIDERTVALAPPELLAAANAARAGRAESVAGNPPFLRLRDAAMPERAGAAALRVTLRLPFDGRVGLARLLELDAVPVAMSVWADVVDDVALVAVMSGDEETTARDLAAAAVRGRERLATASWATARGLAALARKVEVKVGAREVRVVFILGPQTLERVVRRLGRGFAVR